MRDPLASFSQGVFVVSAWTEPTEPALRMRITCGAPTESGQAKVVTVTTDIDVACATLRSWLEELTTDP
jgi:hypothetical protein